VRVCGVRHTQRSSPGRGPDSTVVGQPQESSTWSRVMPTKTSSLRTAASVRGDQSRPDLGELDLAQLTPQRRVAGDVPSSHSGERYSKTRTPPREAQPRWPRYSSR
jgi:hypothetical protein